MDHVGYNKHWLCEFFLAIITACHLGFWLVHVFSISRFSPLQNSSGIPTLKLPTVL